MANIQLGADKVLPLYEGHSLTDAFQFQDAEASVETTVVTKVDRPFLFAYEPKTAPNGHSILVLGGGGYTQLMTGREGVAVARWLASLGFRAYVLVHRFPNSDHGLQASLDDARQALRLMAEDAPAESAKIAVCGLSSGGHLGAALLAEYPSSWTPSPAPADSSNSIPEIAFAIIGYGPISTNAKGRTIIPDKAPLPPAEKQAFYDAVQPDVTVVSPAPPTFIVYSNNDPIVPVVNAYRLAEGLSKAGGSVELHVFADAPHGFGIDTEGLPVSSWPTMCEAWLRQIKVVAS